MSRGRGGGTWASLKRGMAWKSSGRVILVLLATLSLWAFLPALAPLPALSSSDSSSFSERQSSEATSRAFWIADDMFWKDGHPFQIIGGDLHYFRVPPQYWKDRLLRAKALGLNTIQTYVPWNLHEPLPKEWVFDGIADLESFLRLAQDLGFLIMLRVGPYICAEWDLGGFPAWLLAIEPALRLRSSDPAFLHLVERWWDVLLPKIAPLSYNNGGPIFMVQIENEFGSFGDDKPYLHGLVALARRHLGDEIVLYTTDGGTRDTLKKGYVPGGDVFAAVDFSTGEDPWPIFQLQKKFNSPGKSPPLSAEFYTGWLTHWGEHIAATDAGLTAAALQNILSGNGSAVLYMAHGGTNFGFYNGANTGQNDSDYKPDLTSYDYDAPIKEYGDVDNSKFRALRSVIEKYNGPLPPLPPNNGRSRYGQVKVSKVASMFEVIDSLHDPMEVVENNHPLPMELVGQMFGFLLYVSEYHTQETKSTLVIPKIHDRAQVFVSCSLDESRRNPRYVGLIERWSSRQLTIPKLKCDSNISLFVLVENLGRINYGTYIYDKKGILSDVILDGTVLLGWKMFPISFYNLSNSLQVNTIMQVAEPRTDGIFVHKDQPGTMSQVPGIYEGKLFIESTHEVKDTFIAFHGWNKGVVFVNNFNVGRFWPSVGPQCTLYLPAPFLKHGENVVVILELHAPNPDLTVDFIEHPDFTCSSKPPQL